MAMRMTHRWSQRWPRGWQAAWLPVALLVVFGLGNGVRADDLVRSNPPLQSATIALLESEETGYSVISRDVSMALQTAPFKKEPAAGLGKVLRGVLKFGGNASNSIPFLWQKDAGKLFLDLNRNQDLTDDPAGIFSAGAQRQANYLVCTGVRLSFNTPSGMSRILADLTFWDFGRQPMCFAAVRSYWQGKVTLQGRDWQAGLVQNLAENPGSFENGQLLLRPWEERDRQFGADSGSPDAFPFSPNLFVDGHAYALGLISGSQNGEARPSLQFTERATALGELKITGQFIQRLALASGPYLVVLDLPAPIVKVPLGGYGQPKIRLAQGGVEAFCPGSFSRADNWIAVNDKTPVTLAAGGPLNNTVTANRQGRDLRLDYKLLGAGGQAYSLVRHGPAVQPEFAVYKGDKKIASGKFEFG